MATLPPPSGITIGWHGASRSKADPTARGSSPSWNIPGGAPWSGAAPVGPVLPICRSSPATWNRPGSDLPGAWWKGWRTRTPVSLGFVVGATAPAALRRARQLLPEGVILVPGGGDLPAAVRASVDGRGRRAIICVARELTQCRSGAARAAAARRDELAEILAELGYPLG